MIIVRLMGGLGNQLFQYAAARRLAHYRKVPLKLDLSYFNQQAQIAPHDTPRQYLLGNYKIIEQFASHEEIVQYTSLFKGYISGRYFHALEKRLPYFLRKAYFPHSLEFDPAVLKLGKNIHLEGYWQSWRYFIDIQDIIRNEFKLKFGLNTDSLALADRIYEKTSIGVHIRRGDYVSRPSTNQFHGVCNLDYYQTAIKRIVENVENPFFYIFSDEPEWVKKNFKIDFPFTVLDLSGNDHEDLFLLSMCRHFIIANSSYSWWGAWLSNSSTKIVIAPERWFASAPIDMRNLAFQDWLLI